jgi:hypothetical protein
VLCDCLTYRHCGGTGREGAVQSED